MVVGPFGPDLKKEYAPEGKVDLLAEFDSVNGQKLKWQPAQAEPSGLLNLKAIFNGVDGSDYALTFVHSAADQPAKLMFGSDGIARVWVNGAMVHQIGTARAAKADEDTVPISLKMGWNPVLTKVVHGTQGVYMRFVGNGLRVSRAASDEKLPGPGK